MRLSYLLEGTDVLSDYYDREIADVTDTTARLKKSCAFVCVEGCTVDGHTLCKMACKGGATAVITERDIGCPLQVIVRDTKKAYALMCKRFFGNACDTLALIGVTGTNGKTSVAFIIKDILESLGERCGVIGTLGAVFEGETFGTAYTTPCPYELHKIFKEFKERGVRYCVVEASSQALSQGRLYGVCFSVGVFTNLTRDHLDYHKSLENYRDSKRLLFSLCKTAVINGDDENGAYMVSGAAGKAVTYGKGVGCDVKAEKITLMPSSVSFEVFGRKVEISLPGEFSVYNSLAAVTALSAAGIDFFKALSSLDAVNTVKGRMELLNTNTDFKVFIDFAHTEDGIKKVLAAAREFTKGNIITVFGCGGNRDSGKRRLMGKAAAKLSQILVITSDNPRSEKPFDIIEEIYCGAKDNCGKIALSEDRREAIALALCCAKKDDTVMLLGKGHEQYQIIGNKKIRFDEREIVKSLLKKGV